jgi:hypothetical protein
MNISREGLVCCSTVQAHVFLLTCFYVVVSYGSLHTDQSNTLAVLPALQAQTAAIAASAPQCTAAHCLCCRAGWTQRRPASTVVAETPTDVSAVRSAVIVTGGYPQLAVENVSGEWKLGV